MENHLYIPKAWLFFALLFSASAKSEGSIGPQRKSSHNFYSSDSRTSVSTVVERTVVRQPSGDILEQIAETLSSNPTAASGGLSVFLTSVVTAEALPSVSPIVDDNMPMGSSPAMVTPMISSTPFAGGELTAGDGPLPSSSPMVSPEPSVTLLTSPSPDMSAPILSPMMTEVMPSAVAIPSPSLEPEPTSQGPSPFPSEDMNPSPAITPTPFAQEAMTPMMSPPPSESAPMLGGDGTMDMPLVSVSPTLLEASATPGSIIDEMTSASFPDTSTSPNVETPMPSMTVQTTPSPQEASPDPFSDVSPQPSSLMGTPIASMLPMASEASDGVGANETPSVPAMTLTLEMMTAQVSPNPEVSNMMTPDPLLSSASPGLIGPEVLEPLDMPSTGMDDVDEDDPMITPAVTDDVMAPSPMMTMTASMMPTMSATATPSVSLSTSPSMSISVSPSMSISVSPSMSSSLTPSASASMTPTPSVSISVSPSMSASVTPSASASMTATPTVSISVSPSMSSSMVPSASASVTPSASMSATPSTRASPIQEEPDSSVAPTRTPKPVRGPARTPRPSRRPKRPRKPNRRPDRDQRPNGRPGKRPTRPRSNEMEDESVSDMEYETIRVGPKPLEKWLDSGSEKARKIVWGVGPHMPE